MMFLTLRILTAYSMAETTEGWVPGSSLGNDIRNVSDLKNFPAVAWKMFSASTLESEHPIKSVCGFALSSAAYKNLC